MHKAKQNTLAPLVERTMSSTHGTLFKTTTFGESHCKAVGVVIDGCPPGLELTEKGKNSGHTDCPQSQQPRPKPL